MVQRNNGILVKQYKHWVLSTEVKKQITADVSSVSLSLQPIIPQYTLINPTLICQISFTYIPVHVHLSVPAIGMCELLEGT